MNAKEFVKTWSGKKELSDLPALDLSTLDIKSKTFEKDGKQVPYNYITFDNYDYALKSSVLAQIKVIIEQKPLCNKIQFKKAHNGDIMVFDL
jgi:hypothetical protein